MELLSLTTRCLLFSRRLPRSSMMQTLAIESVPGFELAKITFLAKENRVEVHRSRRTMTRSHRLCRWHRDG